MIRGCLLGLSLSIVVVTIAGFRNASQQAQEVRALHRTVEALRHFTASEFAETRHAANSSGRKLTQSIKMQADELAAAEKQLANSRDLITILQKKLQAAQLSHQQQLAECRRQLSANAQRAESHVSELSILTDDLSIRMDEFAKMVIPLRYEVSSVKSSLSRRIDNEKSAREKLAKSCQSALAADGKMLDSYCYALRALAESRKVRAVVEQELAAEAELEADLLNRLADDARGELDRLAEQKQKPADPTARIAQVPADRPANEPSRPASEPNRPILIDATSGQAPNGEFDFE